MAGVELTDDLGPQGYALKQSYLTDQNRSSPRGRNSGQNPPGYAPALQELRTLEAPCKRVDRDPERLNLRLEIGPTGDPRFFSVPLSH